MSMKSALLACSALVGISASAIAADLPMRSGASAPAPMFVQAQNWTGVYVGAQVGAASTYANAPVFSSGSGSGSGVGNLKKSTTQTLVGGYFGYDHQFGSVVVGVEADANARFGTSKPDLLFPIAIIPGAHLNWDASVRARVGFLVTPKALVYATGGVAFANAQVTDYGFFNGALQDAFNGVRTGWTVGGGIQYAMDSNWSGRIEYRYSDYGSKTVCDGECATLGLKDHKVTVGLSYKFGGVTAPIVAKY